MSDTGSGARRIEYLRLPDLAGAAVNPKRHDTTALAASIGRYGFADALILDERTGRVVAGHGRLEHLAAASADAGPVPDGIGVDADGTWLVPVQRGWSSTDDEHARAFLLAHNRLTETGGWDTPQLLDELTALDAAGLLEATGFDTAALDALLAADQAAADTAAGTGGGIPGEQDEPPEVQPRTGPPVTRPGDLWELGPHRLICADARDPDTYPRLLAGAAVDVAFTSPPYAAQRDYDPTSGFTPIPPDQYVEWFAPIAAHIAAHLAPTGSWFVNIKPHTEDGQRVLYVADLMLAHVRAWGWRLVDELCWEHPGLPGTFPDRFKNGWEPVFHYTRRKQIRFNPEANAHESGRAVRHSPERHFGMSAAGYSEYANRREGPGLALPSNVIRVGAGGAGTGSALGHSAVFPVALPAWFIRAYTDPGDTILDPFAGSGSTLLAADRENRVGYGIEVSPQYADVICRRYQAVTGTVPIRDGAPVDFTTATGD